MDIRVCGYTECAKDFDSKTHNQRYCSDECCRLATNKRIMEKYYEKKERRKGGKRVCKNKGCLTVLNRYNDLEVCAGCLVKNKSRNIQLIREVIRGGTG